MQSKPAPVSARYWFERFPRALPPGIFLLTSAVTLFAVAAIESSEKLRREAELSQISKVLGSAIERRADAHDAYLRSAAAVLATQQASDVPLFRTYLEQLRLNGNYRGAKGIGWAMRVDRADFARVRSEIARAGAGTFTVRPLPDQGRSFAVSVIYTEPGTADNRSAIGFSPSSEPVRRQAMTLAAQRGRPTATGKLVLMQDSARNRTTPGFIIYMPVFEPGAGGIDALKGFVYSPFAAHEFLASALQLENRGGIGVRLFDRTRNPANLLAQLPASEPSGIVRSTPLMIANHPWVLVVEANRAPWLSPLSLLTLVFGTLVASLLLILARMVTRRAEEDRQALAWLEEQASIRNSLTRELNHRVKNTLANVLSIISLTKRRAPDLETFASDLEARIRALSATHDLLTKSEWGTTPIGAVVSAELSPFVQDSERALELTGPAVELAPNDALALGLALHELATNAAKFGALSVPEGKVTIAWKLIAPDLARIEWAEHNGPPVPQDARKRGFGSELIEKIVAHELRNPVELRFDPDGVRCGLILPVRRPSTFALRAAGGKP